MQTRFIVFTLWSISFMIILLTLLYPLKINREYMEEKEWQDAIKSMIALVVPQITIVISFIFQTDDGTTLFQTFRQVEVGSKFAIILILLYNIVLSFMTIYFLRFDSNDPFRYFSDGVRIITFILGIFSFLPAAAMAYLFKTGKSKKDPSSEKIKPVCSTT